MGKFVDIKELEDPIDDVTGVGLSWGPVPVTWTYYWHLYDGAKHVNGGLATTYEDAVKKADHYWKQYKWPRTPRENP